MGCRRPDESRSTGKGNRVVTAARHAAEVKAIHFAGRRSIDEELENTMPTPTKADISTCQQISNALVDQFVRSRGKVNLDPFLPDEFAKGMLGSVKVFVQPVVAQYDDMDRIEATSDITLKLPSQGYATCRDLMSLPFLPRLHKIAFSALVHEFVHTLQRAAAPTSFTAAVVARNAFDKRREASNNQLPAADWVSSYYGIPEELEAHAVQAAAEALLAVSSGQSSASYAAINASEAYKRIASRIGAPGSNGPAIDAWWVKFNAAAKIAYSAWP